MATIDWDELQKQADEAGFFVYPEGDYDVVIDSAKVAKTADKSKDKISVWFKVTSGPHAGKGTIMNDFVLTTDNNNALGFFFRHMAALGLTREYFSAKPSLERVANDLVGRRARIAVSIRQWNSQDRNQVDKITAVIGGAQPPATPRAEGVPAPGPAAAPAGPPVPRDIPAGPDTPF